MFDAAPDAVDQPDCNSPPKTVLVVDRDVVDRTSIAAHLRYLACNVLEAADCDEAVAHLSDRSHIDFVLLDAGTPGRLNGIALAIWLHANAPNLPVLITCDADDAPFRGSAPGGIRPGIRKPYSHEDVARKIWDRLS